MKTTLSFIRFVKNPSGNHSISISTIERLRTFLIIFFVSKIIDTTLLLTKILLHNIGLNTKLVYESDVLTSGKVALLPLLVIWFYMPVKEELAFRLALKYKPIHVTISISLLLTIIIKIILNKTFLVNYSAMQYFLIDFFVLVSVMSIVYFLVGRFETTIEKLYSGSMKSIIFLSVSLFSILHFNRVTIESYSWHYALPFLIEFLRLALYGFLFSYLRLVNGITWSIAFHVLCNIILVH